MRLLDSLLGAGATITLCGDATEEPPCICVPRSQLTNALRAFAGHARCPTTPDAWHREALDAADSTDTAADYLMSHVCTVNGYRLMPAHDESVR